MQPITYIMLRNVFQKLVLIILIKKKIKKTYNYILELIRNLIFTKKNRRKKKKCFVEDKKWPLLFVFAVKWLTNENMRYEPKSKISHNFILLLPIIHTLCIHFEIDHCHNRNNIHSVLVADDGVAVPLHTQNTY